MSEKVKLIIEIPKDAYSACRALKTNNDQGILTFCVVNAVANGTPLDDVNAEINSAKVPKNRMSFFRDGIDCALYILDSIGKEVKC